jgi:hypothetical protein
MQAMFKKLSECLRSAQAATKRRRLAGEADPPSALLSSDAAFEPVGAFVVRLAKDPSRRDALASMLAAAAAASSGVGDMEAFFFRRLIAADCAAALVEVLPESAALESYLQSLIMPNGTAASGSVAGSVESIEDADVVGPAVVQHVQLLAVLYERRGDWRAAVAVLSATALRRWTARDGEVMPRRQAVLDKALGLVRCSGHRCLRWCRMSALSLLHLLHPPCRSPTRGDHCIHVFDHMSVDRGPAKC